MSAFTFRVAVVLALLLVRPAAAFTILEPSVDYRNYSHALSPGGSTTGSVWGAVGDADLDDRASQFLVRFNTSSVATPARARRITRSRRSRSASP